MESPLCARGAFIFFVLVFLRPLWAGYVEEGDKTLELALTYYSSQQQEAAIVDWASNRGCFFMQRSPFVVKVSLGLGVSPEGDGNGEYGEQGTSQARIFLPYFLPSSPPCLGA